MDGADSCEWYCQTHACRIGAASHSIHVTAPLPSSTTSVSENQLHIKDPVLRGPYHDDFETFACGISFTALEAAPISGASASLPFAGSSAGGGFCEGASFGEAVLSCPCHSNHLRQMLIVLAGIKPCSLVPQPPQNAKPGFETDETAHTHEHKFPDLSSRDMMRCTTL
eukprot:2880310-Rhodomonas_salina.1